MAKRVSPHPLSPIVTLSRTAQALCPPSGRSLQLPRPPQPPPLCPSPSPIPGPLLSHPPHPRVPLPFSMSARNRFASICLCVVRAAVRASARSPLPGPSKSQGASFKRCRCSSCLAQGLWVAVCRGQAQWVAPFIIIHFHTPLFWGYKPWFQVILCSWDYCEEGAKGRGTTVTPKPFTCLVP